MHLRSLDQTKRGPTCYSADTMAAAEQTHFPHTTLTPVRAFTARFDFFYPSFHHLFYLCCPPLVFHHLRAPSIYKL